MPLTLTLLLLACAAPAPPPRPAPPVPCPTPGVYRMAWGGSEYLTRFRPGGAYTAVSPHGGACWRGAWGYCPRTRTLAVTESADGERWAETLFRMRGLSGTGPDGLTLQLTPLAEPAGPHREDY